MKLRLTCRCGQDFGEHRPGEIAGALLKAHATLPHSAPGHGLLVEPPPEGPVLVEVECQGSRGGAACPHQGVRRAWRVPEWFAAAVVIQAHASCEGHPFRLWLAGTEIATAGRT